MIRIDPQNESSANIYKLLVGAIVPRPIAFVSTSTKGGIRNLAPFSFFTVVSADPPVICFSSMVRSDGSQKDTLRNIQATGEFVVNIVSEDIIEKMNICSGDYTRDIDEFTVSGLTPIASEIVAPVRVKECRIQMECTLVQILPGNGKPNGGSLVIGEVVRFHVDDTCIDNFHIDPDVLHPIGRMGGPSYTRTNDRFDMARPKVPRP